MDRSLDLHRHCTLYQTQSKFYIQPRDEQEEALIINRQTGEITLNQMFSTTFLPYDAQSCLIHGLIGIKQLTGSAYLIVITSSSCVGRVNGHYIYKVEQTQIIPFESDNRNSISSKSSSRQHDWENIYIKMLESVLQTPNFYFSHSYDITNTLQRNNAIATMKNDQDDYVDCQYYDRRFLWNDHLMSNFERFGTKLAKYRLPLIQGFLSVNENALGHGVNWILISRRGTKRAGTRYNTRGVDRDGNVANYVETEQIIERRGDVQASFVQIRGSIPLYWCQRPSYKRKPAIEILQYDHSTAMKKHFDELRRVYGNVAVVSLIDQRGHEGKLSAEFTQGMSIIQKYYNTPYYYFDFHKECSKMRWHRLNILLERLEDAIKACGFFAINGNNVISHQTGVIRSNCIDSLDRTNVIQSMIAQYILQTQLSLFGANLRGLTLASYPIFMDTFKSTWADNADTLSIEYAGTPALKTDFTRTGQRTYTGMANDGINSLTRYVTNTFFDSYRQDAIDLFLGNYEGYPSPLYRPLDLTNYTSTFPVTIVMLTLVALYFYFRWE